MTKENGKFKMNDWHNLPERHDGCCCRCGAEIKTERLKKEKFPICEWCWYEREQIREQKRSERREQD